MEGGGLGEIQLSDDAGRRADTRLEGLRKGKKSARKPMRMCSFRDRHESITISTDHHFTRQVPEFSFCEIEV